MTAAEFTMYTQPQCGFCTRASTMLAARGLSCTQLQAGELRAEMNARVVAATGEVPTTVPQIFHGERYVGGFTELSAYLQSSEFNRREAK